MKRLLLTALALGFLTGCVSDPVDVDLSYLEADRRTYDTLSQPLSAMILDQLSEPLASRTENPWTGLPFTDSGLMALEAVLESWEIRLGSVE